MTPPANLETRAPVTHGAELKRGALTNTIALLASNFRGVFTFLVARLLGPATLGTFLVAWAATDIFSKVGIFGLDNTIVTFIARAEAAGDRARSRALFRLAALMAVAQCTALAAISITLLYFVGARLGLDPRMVAALSIMLCALPGLALYRMSTAASRGMKVMRHDIYSRGITESTATTVAFLLAFTFGLTTYAPQIAAVVGLAASGLVALLLAASLFRSAPARLDSFSRILEARRLLAYGAPICGYELLNATIVRLDVILLACFIGRAPGVTLASVGIYGTVVEVAWGCRKVSQAFNPILGPIVAGITAHGKQEHAAQAFGLVAQWMLWVLLPLVAVMTLAGSVILGIYGPAFRAGSIWLGIVALACATDAFFGLSETVIMVQRPRLNLLNSSIALAFSVAANLFLIQRYGMTGAAFGILLPYVLLGALRYRALLHVFRWRNPWAQISHPFRAALLALLPALVARLMFHEIIGEVLGALTFLLVYFAAWQYPRSSHLRSAIS
ncbi:MAG: oligosaccharide flippase family protein [Verrucomicrobiota bacterium]|nr:oligosaccharide flippase family protein [Verrucomicrobiota bacterium]